MSKSIPWVSEKTLRQVYKRDLALYNKINMKITFRSHETKSFPEYRELAC